RALYVNHIYRPLHTVLYSFLFNDPATTEIYTLSLHDALPISPAALRAAFRPGGGPPAPPDPLDRHPPFRRRGGLLPPALPDRPGDRKSTRLNSSHVKISYAVFCLKKKKKKEKTRIKRDDSTNC